MADKTLRQMSREQLLELIHELKMSEDALLLEKEELTAKLNDRTIRVESAGSIAEAALQLNEIFAVAQAAADDYLNSVLVSHTDLEADAEKIRGAAREDAGRMMAEAEAYREKVTKEADAYWASKKEEADRLLGEAEAEAKQITERAERASRYYIRQAKEERDKLLAGK